MDKKLIIAHISNGTPIMPQILQYNLKEVKELGKTIEELEHQNKVFIDRCKGQMCDKCFLLN